MNQLTPELVIQAYQQGVFPMAPSCDEPIDWYVADPRAILPLEDFRVSHSLKQRIRRGDYRVTLDHDFEKVIKACALPRRVRPSTWINDQIITVYTQLHEIGVAHSVEAWSADGQLVGGLYGLGLGGVFFGESMFSLQSDASKVCLVNLVNHLRKRGYSLLDAQIGNDHMKQFGQIEIPLDSYMKLLDAALQQSVTWQEHDPTFSELAGGAADCIASSEEPSLE